jgi:eukaryotic-like serine/threonine-protein kinase
VKTPPKASPTPLASQKQHSSDSLLGSLGTACLVSAVACSGPQVRPPPPPEECPPQAIINMERLQAWGNAGAALDDELPKFVIVREGPGAKVRLFNDLGGIQPYTDY